MARRTLGRYSGPAFIRSAVSPAGINCTWIAEPSPLGARLVWSVMPTFGTVCDEPVAARRVPLAVRRAAVAHFMGIR